MVDTPLPLPNSKKTSASGRSPDSVKPNDTSKNATLATIVDEAHERISERVKEHDDEHHVASLENESKVKSTTDSDCGGKKLCKDTVKRSEAKNHPLHPHFTHHKKDHMSFENTVFLDVEKTSIEHPKAHNEEDEKDTRP